MSAAGPFDAEAFFARARERLAHEPPADDRALGDHHLNPGLMPEGMEYRDAAVLIPVVARAPEPTVLLTLRTAHLSAHAGQIAFPGGKIDAGDASAGAAALREASEEIGLDPAQVAIVGYLDPYLTRTGYRITAALGRVEPGFGLTVNRDEVDEAFEVPLAFLMEPQNHRRGSRTFYGTERSFYEMPFEQRYIWGVTAGIIRALYERIFL